MDDSIPGPRTLHIDEPPLKTLEETPKQPARARIGGVSGSVIVRAYVDQNGKAQIAEAIKCGRPGIGFKESAVEAAYK